MYIGSADEGAMTVDSGFGSDDAVAGRASGGGGRPSHTTDCQPSVPMQRAQSVHIVPSFAKKEIGSSSALSYFLYFGDS